MSSQQLDGWLLRVQFQTGDTALAAPYAGRNEEPGDWGEGLGQRFPKLNSRVGSEFAFLTVPGDADAAGVGTPLGEPGRPRGKDLGEKKAVLSSKKAGEGPES